MPLHNTDARYGKVARFFHWTIALLIILLLIGGSLRHEIPEAYRGTFYFLHKSFGLLVLGLAIANILWMLTQRRPHSNSSMPAWQVFAARLAHLLLYACMLAMPLTGWIMSSSHGRDPSFFGLFTLHYPVMNNIDISHFFEHWHKALAWIIFGVIVVHALAALKHHFIDKDDVLQKML